MARYSTQRYALYEGAHVAFNGLHFTLRHVLGCLYVGDRYVYLLYVSNSDGICQALLWVINVATLIYHS